MPVPFNFINNSYFGLGSPQEIETLYDIGAISAMEAAAMIAAMNDRNQQGTAPGRSEEHTSELQSR